MVIIDEIYALSHPLNEAEPFLPRFFPDIMQRVSVLRYGSTFGQRSKHDKDDLNVGVTDGAASPEWDKPGGSQKNG